MDKVLYAIDSLTGLIIASALMHPEKKISALDTDFVMRRFKVRRNNIPD
jgi:predicted hydrolase (HD superfamily)